MNLPVFARVLGFVLAFGVPAMLAWPMLNQGMSDFGRWFGVLLISASVGVGVKLIRLSR